jgi:hypothetical protein
MLPPFIIEQIRKREEEERSEDARPVLELPIPPREPRRQSDAPSETDRGVVIIEL